MTEGREPKLNNDMFFVCAVIEYLKRETKNCGIDIARKIGEEKLAHILELADVYHCDPIENTATELIEEFNITDGNFDNVSDCQFNVPYYMDIARVYMRLIIAAMEKQKFSPIAAMLAVYSSPICLKIDDYNCSMFFESPQYLYESYLAGEPLKD